MVFSSITFLIYFMPVFFIVYFFLPDRFRNGWILLSSILFFSWGAPVFVFTVIASCLIDYYLASQFNTTHRKTFFTISIILNLALLAYFKYANFFIDNFNFISETLTGESLSFGHILLPVGISFLTFHKISFLYDVYRRECELPSRFTQYLLFIMLFPHLIAGPIVRFKEILPQIKNRVSATSMTNVYYGLLQFMIGLSKKVLIANTLGAHVTSALGGNIADMDFTESWVVMLAYTFQLYFDFSGYSDMAIGMARMMGFQFPENFRFPYTSKSITEFWKRWHITLGSWMRDYLYIPLGGNQLGRSRTYMNLLLVFFLSGLWHGASWNFVIWGMFHGTFLVLERMFLAKLMQKIPTAVQYIYAFVVVVTGWVFFRIESFDDSTNYLANMYSLPVINLAYLHSLNLKFVFVLLIAIFFSFQPRSLQSTWTNLFTQKNRRPVVNATLACSLVLLYVFNLGELYATGFNPFIYFKF